MNKAFLIFALLFLIGCSEESDPVPEQNNEENTESVDDNAFLVNGFSCNIDFNEENYTIKMLSLRILKFLIFFNMKIHIIY